MSRDRPVVSRCAPSSYVVRKTASDSADTVISCAEFGAECTECNASGVVKSCDVSQVSGRRPVDGHLMV